MKILAEAWLRGWWTWTLHDLLGTSGVKTERAINKPTFGIGLHYRHFSLPTYVPRLDTLQCVFMSYVTGADPGIFGRGGRQVEIGATWQSGGAPHKGGAKPSKSGAKSPRRARGRYRAPPQVFSQISEKRLRAAPPFSAYLIMHLFCTRCKNV